MQINHVISHINDNALLYKNKVRRQGQSTASCALMLQPIGIHILTNRAYKTLVKGYMKKSHAHMKKET